MQHNCMQACMGSQVTGHQQLSTQLLVRRRRIRNQQVYSIQLHKQHVHQQQWCVCAAQLRRFSCAASAKQEAPLEWSWSQGKDHNRENGSAFDAEHPLPMQLTTQDALLLLSAGASAADQPSHEYIQQLLAHAEPLIEQFTAAEACHVLEHLSQLDCTPESGWMSKFMQHITTQLGQLTTQQLSALLWALGNLQYTPAQQQWEALLQAGRGLLQDFYGPDLARFVCAGGSIYANSHGSFDPETGVRLPAAEQQPAEGVATAAATAAAALVLPDGWESAVAAEVEYQVAEFVGDLNAFDLARIASGIADLGIAPNQRLQDSLLKAVYMRTRTIEEKGAVDFALAKLDAKGKKSMHYDPRWTHEELKWLPRRERDKRRILKEGWYRTKWAGYTPGQ